MALAIGMRTSELLAGLFAEDAMLGRRRRQDDLAVGSIGDQDGLRHALVERRDVVVIRGGYGWNSSLDGAADARSGRCRRRSDCGA
jgi:hypothetical protein